MLQVFTKSNIGINPPMVNTCSACDKFNKDMEVAEAEKDAAKKSELVTQKRIHLIKANVARNIMQSYGEDNDHRLFVLAMDLQQTLPTPRLTTNVACYKRKMWTYNFGVHNLKEPSQANLYVWNQATAKRSSSEIGSCLMHYIEHHVPENINKLIIFSDNCAGQNKNINLSLLLLRYIHSGRFSMIKHYFLISGHSYLPCDRVFGDLEKHFHGHEIYTTPHYVELMRSARRDSPFTVIEMESDSFINLDPLQEKCSKTQLCRAGFKDGRMFQYSENFKLGIAIWKHYSEDIASPVNVKLQKGRGSTYNQANFDLTSVNLPLKYPNGVKLRNEKLNDLEHLLRFIPLGYRTWYDDLFAEQGLLATQGGDTAMDPDDPEGVEDDILDY